MERIAAAPLSFGRAAVRYQSPSQGALAFGWRGPLRRNGEVVPQRGFGRYESPWVEAPFPSDALCIRAGGATHRLDWNAPERSPVRSSEEGTAVEDQP
jgi:hypothetical protein